MTYSRKLITWSDPGSLDPALTFLSATAAPPAPPATAWSTTWYSIGPVRRTRLLEESEVCDATARLVAALKFPHEIQVFKALSCGDEVTHRETRSAPPGELPTFSAWDELLRLSPEELETRMAEIVHAMTPDEVTHKERRSAPDERPLVAPAPAPQPDEQQPMPAAPGR